MSCAWRAWLIAVAIGAHVGVLASRLRVDPALRVPMASRHPALPGRVDGLAAREVNSLSPSIVRHSKTSQSLLAAREMRSLTASHIRNSPLRTSSGKAPASAGHDRSGDRIIQAQLEEARAHPFWSKFKAIVSCFALCIALLGPPRLVGGSGTLPPSLSVGPEAAQAKVLSYSSGAKVNKDPNSLLQLALPLEETLGDQKVEPVRGLQKLVEQSGFDARIRSGSSTNDAADAKSLLQSQRKAILQLASAARKSEVEKILTDLNSELDTVKSAAEQVQKSGPGSPQEEAAFAATKEQARKCQELIGRLEIQLVPDGYVAPVPKYVPANLPRLNGRATVEFVLKRPEKSEEKKFSIEATLYEQATLKLVVDGWSAPISAGNFIDLVDKGYYSATAIQRADGFIIQFGDSGAKSKNGYMMENGKVRRIPLEIAVKGEKSALYGETLDELKRFGDQVKIPFQVDGTLAMAREEYDNDSASAQVFIFLFEPDMTPAGKNLLDGRYSTFGYATEGSEFLRQIKPGDIITTRVIDGLDRLVRPS